MKKRTDLNHYGYNEGTSFDGLMDNIAKIIGSIGRSDIVVPMHGMDANGMDPLEVVDLSEAFASSILPGTDGDFFETDFNNDFYISEIK